MILLFNCGNPSSNPLQGACSGFPIAAYELKIVRKPPVILSAGHGCTLEKNPPMRVKDCWNINCILLTEQFLKLISVFKEASRNLAFIFLLNTAG
jgi:hypothetical protein